MSFFFLLQLYVHAFPLKRAAFCEQKVKLCNTLFLKVYKKSLYVFVLMIIVLHMQIKHSMHLGLMVLLK